MKPFARKVLALGMLPELVVQLLLEELAAQQLWRLDGTELVLMGVEVLGRVWLVLP